MTITAYPYDHHDARGHDDRRIAARTRLGHQPTPRSMAESAVAAWNRDELDEIGDESCDEFDLRDDAAELTLVGLAVSTRGVRDGEDVVVNLDVIRSRWHNVPLSLSG